MDDERLSVESGNESEIPENAAVDLSQAGKIIEQVARLDEIYRSPMELLARGYWLGHCVENVPFVLESMDGSGAYPPNAINQDVELIQTLRV